MKYRWVLRQIDEPDMVRTMQQALNDLPKALARALVLRGVTTFERARRYFRPSMEHLHDPFLMQDMDAAAERVAQAIRQDERVLVYGDYDVDGTTSTALMTHFLRSQGVEATYFIPDRFEHGYGLSKDGIDQAIERGAGLIISIDCGITAHEEAQYARDRGVDLIICDHHKTGTAPPEAVAVLDPKRPDCSYPFKELSGCGVAFKLAQAVLHCLDASPELALPYLDLVAISTASDIVPLGGENRVLMREGLKRIKASPRLGLRKLAEHAQLDLDTVSSTRIVFGIGPRINAAGRMGDAKQAVALMLTDDEAEAARLAQELERANQKRRAIDRETLDAAARRAERQLTARTRHSIVLHDPDWHLGVIGIVASRLVERFHRPTIMMCSVNGALKGSARSINGVNIYEALTTCEDLLSTFGGHDHAAGLSLPEEHLSEFQDRFDAAVREVVTPEMLMPSIEVDAPLKLDVIDDRFWSVLKQFAPFGPENSRPIFHARDLRVAGQPRTVGKNGSHLKFNVRQQGPSNRAPLDVIGFGLGHKLDMVQTSQREGRPLELAFSVEENTWRGVTKLQLRARDVRLEQAE